MIIRATLCVAVAFAASFSAADKIDKWAKDQMAARHIPGMIVGVYRHGKPVKVGTYGFADLESSVPVKRNSIFEICSITKQFTAVAVLLLVEDGKLELDSPVGKYLPDWPTQWKSVTIRHLLNHTSGINDDLYADWEKPLSEVMKLMTPTMTVPPE
ncbi:MAG: beta-lactamase family protein, partial [Armatimonadetes bacterium]|nr:beta-lactamase family protein [Armatimonadota bacterium]